MSRLDQFEMVLTGVERCIIQNVNIVDTDETVHSVSKTLRKRPCYCNIQIFLEEKSENFI